MKQQLLKTWAADVLSCKKKLKKKLKGREGGGGGKNLSWDESASCKFC